MFKSCSRCGKIHDSKYQCNHNKEYKYTDIQRLRNKNVWHNKSNEIRKKSKYLCAICKEEGIYNYTDLEVHHITSIADDKDRLLDNYNLICLCNEHHRQAEIGKIDKDYLYKLAKQREDD